MRGAVTEREDVRGGADAGGRARAVGVRQLGRHVAQRRLQAGTLTQLPASIWADYSGLKWVFEPQ